MCKRSRRLWKGVSFSRRLPQVCLFVCLASDSADGESLSPDSSDEENEDTEEEEQKAELTSMDWALRTVTDTAERSQEDFLKQNFETLTESSSKTGDTSLRFSKIY